MSQVTEMQMRFCASSANRKCAFAALCGEFPWEIPPMPRIGKMSAPFIALARANACRLRLLASGCGLDAIGVSRATDSLRSGQANGPSKA